MALILHIDTATENASVCLSEDLNVIAFAESKKQKNHASFLQPAIQSILKNSSTNIHQIDAISVTNGPGSYTGLRVGLASAKGLCFALNKPLILLNTLEVMASSCLKVLGIGNSQYQIPNNNYFFAPMIDARRMEVFTALYTSEMTPIFNSKSLILDENSFGDYLKDNKIYFSGSGVQKTKNFIQHPNALFSSIEYSAKNMVSLSFEKFNKKDFADLAYASPNYGKAFFTTMKINLSK